MNKKTLLFLGLFSILGLFLRAQKNDNVPKNFGNSIFYEQIKKQAQENNGIVKCGAYEYDSYLNSIDSKKETVVEFESWLAPKIEQYKRKRQTMKVADQLEVITIPVVVHVVHSNKGYGVDENITDEQILSQITVLNQDFRRMLGTPGHNTNPVGADIEVEFCLAQRTPEGLPTSGINRINKLSPVIVSLPGLGDFSTWTLDLIEDELKPTTGWNPNEYLNVWLVDTIEFGSLAGYAQFPVSSGLNGLDGGSINNGAETDGVVVAHNCFGSSDIYPEGIYMAPYDKGRTTTHEIGHWLGLRHIWGETNSCVVDAIDSFNDYCLDTPPANTANQTTQGCAQISTCSADSMLENYMDYTGDACQNIFTEDQKIRIRTVLDNSPRRNTLVTSLGCTPTEVYGFDAGIEIISPSNDVCYTNNTPIVKLINFGDEVNLSSAQISYGTENNIQIFNWVGTIVPGDSEDITLSSVAFPVGTNTFTVSLTSVNGDDDDNDLNNEKSIMITKPEQFTGNIVTFTLTTDNYGDETYWNLKNSNGVLLYEGGGPNPYEDNVTVTQELELNSSDCYTFTILDLGFDGICCDYGQGSYTLSVGSETIFSGGTFSVVESNTFLLETTASIDTKNIFDHVMLYPNPTNSLLNVVVGTSDLPEQILIYNMLGQVVKNQSVNDSKDLSVDVSSFANGVYLIKIAGKGQSKTMRFIKQ